MIRSRIALALALCFAATAHADTAAPITSVVLYPGSATVERTAQVTPGMTQLELKNLPAGFDLQTLRVEADAGIQVGQVVTQQLARADAPNPREAELDAKLQALRDSRAVLEIDAKSAALVQNYLEHLNGGERGAGAADAKAVAGMIDAIRRGGHEAFDKIRSVELQTRDIDKKIAALQRDLDRVHGASKDVRNITVTISAHQAGAVRVSYQINGAGWRPSYRAALNVKTSTVELERMASVAQKTGEDWSGVRMRLSTGQPRLSPQAADPGPRILSYQPPAVYKYAQPPPMPISAVSARAVSPASSELVSVTGNRIQPGDDYIAPVMESQGAYATEFEAPTRVDLPSDGREISVALSKSSIAVTQRVRVAPRANLAAVVTAEASRPAGIWLIGTVQLYRDGSYVGATSWNPQASDQLVLPFGRDDLVRVTVDRGSEQSATTGLLTQRAERKVDDVITLTSFHTTPIDVLMLEASPVSTDEEIKVQATYAPQPGITDWEKRRGVLGWEKTLAPKESMKVGIHYTISYPKEGRVFNLP